MNEATLLLIASIAFVLALSALMASIILLRRDHKSQSNASDQLGIIRVNNQAESLSFPSDNLLTRLSFEDSLDALQFESACRESVVANLSRQIAANAADGVTLVVN